MIPHPFFDMLAAMRRVTVILLLLALPLSVAGADLYRPGEYLVKYRQGVPSRKIAAKVAEFGGREVRRFHRVGIRHLALPTTLSPREALERLRSDPDVEYAVPNRIVRKALIPNDPLFPLQWGLLNSGQTIQGNFGRYDGIAGADANLPAAWERTTGSRGVTVALIDTGIDHLHPDLIPNIWRNDGETSCTDGVDNDGNGYADDCRGWDFPRDRNDPFDDDVDSHGTHVAGIVGAVGGNGVGTAGASWAVSLLSLKILDSQGYGDMAGIIAAIDYAIQSGARIINASYTYPQYCAPTDPDTAELDALRAADRAGILVVAAAGNGGCTNDKTPFYPASHPLPHIISVAATTPLDSLATFSNRGVNTVHVAAPGVNILSTIRHTEMGVYSGIAGYDYLSGTSMSAPLVTGIAALAASLHPDWSNRQLREAILLSTVGKGYPIISGGRVDAERVLAVDLSRSPPFAPTHLSLTQNQDQSRTLSWVDNSTIEEAYHVERKSAGGSFVEIATLPADTTTFQDSQILSGESEIAYRIRASNPYGFSGYTIEVATVSSLTPPTNLTATVGTDRVVTLTWENGSTLNDGFKIERRSDADPEFYQIGTTSRSLTTWADTGIHPGTRYHYRVRAYRTNGANSPYGNEVVVDIPPEGGDRRCFIATAAYGTPLHPKVATLREFRDRWLMTGPIGRGAVEVYYLTSPPIASVVARHEPLRMVVRGELAILIVMIEHPVVTLLLLAGVVLFAKNLKTSEQGV